MSLSFNVFLSIVKYTGNKKQVIEKKDLNKRELNTCVYSHSAQTDIESEKTLRFPVAVN